MLMVPINADNVRKIQRLCIKHNLTADDSLNEFWNTLPPVPQTIPGFSYTLKNYQAEGVSWLEKMGGRGLLGDEMGTGKTVQVMAYIHRNSKIPAMIICPNSIKFNWRNEILATTGDAYKINLIGKSYSKKETARRARIHSNVIYSKELTPGCDIYIINYDIVSRNLLEIEKAGIQFIAADESHKIKNYKAKRTEAIVRLATGIENRKNPKTKKIDPIKVSNGIESVVFMSGTPQVNRPNELWTSVNTLTPWVPEFSQWTRFGFRYCGAVNNGYGWNFGGSSNTIELNALLTKHVMLRRLKSDVLKELPPKIYTTIPLDFDRAEYDRVVDAFNGKVNWKEGMESIVKFGGNPPTSDEAIVEIQKLREIAGYAKLDSAAEWIQDYTEEGAKIVVFAHHRNIIEQIRNKLLSNDSSYHGTVPVIMGGISNDERDEAVYQFQNNPDAKVILVSITAGGFGLTLTAARAVAFVQLPWTPGDLQQAADRVHRVGQDADSVDVFNLVAEGTIEEEIADLIISKALVMDLVLDAGRVVNTVDLKTKK